MKINPMLKRAVMIVAGIVLVVFALIGMYRCWYLSRISGVRDYVVARDAVEKKYDADFLFQQPDGEPLFLTRPEYKSTVFIIGGFRAAHFLEYFKQLHQNEKVNVIAPLAGLSSWPFDMRNREWFYQEDMRAFYQYYNAYTARLEPGHRVVVVSMSFGALSNTVIGARAQRKPDAMIFLSPLNTHLDYRAASPFMAWLSGKMAILQHIIPMVVLTGNPARAGMWDIVNDELNQRAWNEYGTRVVNWEENLHHAVRVREAAAWYEKDLVPRVKGEKIVIIYGDDDLFFNKDGFLNLGRSFENAGNTVRMVELEKTGHMVLNDNGGPRAKQIIADIAHGTFDWTK